MKKVKINVFILIMVLLLALSLAACNSLDAAKYKGECTINLKFDKLYDNLYVSCPQGAISKVNDTNYSISLADLHPVKVTITADGSAPLYLNYNYDELKSGNITKDIVLGEQKYTYKIQFEDDLNEDFTTNLKDCTINKLSSKSYELITNQSINEDIYIYINEYTLPSIISKDKITYKLGTYGTLEYDIKIRRKDEYFCVISNKELSYKSNNNYDYLGPGINFLKLEDSFKILFNNSNLIYTREDIINKDNVINLSFVEYNILSDGIYDVEFKIKNKHYSTSFSYGEYIFYILEDLQVGDIITYNIQNESKMLVVTSDIINSKTIDLSKGVLLQDIPDNYFINSKIRINLVDDYNEPYQFNEYKYEYTDFVNDKVVVDTYPKDHLFDIDFIKQGKSLIFTENGKELYLNTYNLVDDIYDMMNSRFDGQVHDGEIFDLNYVLKRYYRVNIKVVDKDSNAELNKKTLTLQNDFFDFYNLGINESEYGLYKINDTLTNELIYDYKTYGTDIIVYVYKKYTFKFKIMPGNYEQSAYDQAFSQEFDDNTYTLSQLLSPYFRPVLPISYFGEEYLVKGHYYNYGLKVELKYDYFECKITFTENKEYDDYCNGDVYIAEIVFIPHKNFWYQGE